MSIKKISISSMAIAASLVTSQAALVLADGVIQTTATSLFSASNLIATTGMDLGGDGLTVDDVFTSEASGSTSWVTNEFGGANGDYFASGGVAATFDFTFSVAQNLNGIAVWGYPHPTGAGNAVSSGTVEFFAGTTSLGSETFGVGLSAVSGVHQPGTLSSYRTYTGVTKAIVTFTDNHFETTAGGGRLGAGTVAFNVVPEPSSAVLLGLGGIALILRRRK